MSDDEKERPKRSWREIDRMRDIKTSRTSPLPTTHSTLKGQAAKRYRSQLDRIFSGGGLPEEIKRQAPAVAVAPAEKSSRQIKIDAVLASVTPEEIATSVDAFLDDQPMPTDPELLAKILSHPKGLYSKPALEHLLETLENGKPTNARLLKTRVQSIKLIDDDEDVQHLATCALARL
jgi:hypothetical protein